MVSEPSVLRPQSMDEMEQQIMFEMSENLQKQKQSTETIKFQIEKMLQSQAKLIQSQAKLQKNLETMMPRFFSHTSILPRPPSQPPDPPDVFLPLLSELMSLKQHDDSVEMYLVKFERALSRLSLPVAHVLNIFLTNMSSHLASHVRQFDVTTVSDAAWIAKRFESSLINTPAIQPRAPFNPYQTQNNQSQDNNMTQQEELIQDIETIREIGLIQEHESPKLTDAIMEVDCVHSQEFSSQFQVPIPSLEPSRRRHKESLVVVNDLSSNFRCVIGKTIGCNCDSEIGQDNSLDEEEFNRVWEPGGVFIKHDKWQGLEKCYKRGRLMRLMHWLSSMWWKETKSREFDRLSAWSWVSIETWHCVKHETQQTNFHVWHRWKNKAEKLPADYAVLELMMLGLVSFQFNRGNGVVGLVPKAIRVILVGSFSGGGSKEVSLVCSGKSLFFFVVYVVSADDQTVALEKESFLPPKIIREFESKIIAGMSRGQNIHHHHGKDYENEKLYLLGIEVKRAHMLLLLKEIVNASFEIMDCYKLDVLMNGLRYSMNRMEQSEKPLITILSYEVYHSPRPPELSRCKEDEESTATESVSAIVGDNEAKAQKFSSLRTRMFSSREYCDRVYLNHTTSIHFYL